MCSKRNTSKCVMKAMKTRKAIFRNQKDNSCKLIVSENVLKAHTHRTYFCAFRNHNGNITCARISALVYFSYFLFNWTPTWMEIHWKPITKQSNMRNTEIAHYLFLVIYRNITSIYWADRQPSSLVLVTFIRK